MKQLIISNNAVNSYFNYFKDDITKEISYLYNEEFVITDGDTQLSFTFLDKLTVVLIKKKETILDIAHLSYDQFISDTLIKNIMNKPYLAPRLERYKALGLVRFKEEIIENLQLGNIYMDDEGIILWADYKLKFRLNNSLSLEYIN